MAKNVIQYDLLVSCPGDIKEEIECIKSTVEQFNSSFADALGISIRIKHWSKNSYPQSGGKPQALLNEQFIYDCDAAVAIMWTRFGTPTDEYGSGTEEEIEIMLKDGKQVFMYFCDKPLKPSMMDSDEYNKVIAFKEKYKDRGIYYTFSSTEDFKKVFYAHLSQYFLSLNKVAELKKDRCSELCIKGIEPLNHISDNAFIQNFKLKKEYNKEEFIAKIKEYYSKINSIKMERTSSNSLISIFPPAKIEANDKELITKIAELLEIEISDTFFDLGNLKVSITTSLFSSVSGTYDEEEKYHLIQELCDTLKEFSHWSSANEKLANLKCISLVLTNNGSDYDEDVEVSITVPKSALVTVDSFPKLSENNMQYLMNNINLYKMLQIPATAEYLDYDASFGHEMPVASPVKLNHDILGSTYDVSESFKDCLVDALGVDVYPADDKYIVKIRFDYIKHNTSVAFPAIILFFEDISEIPYTITSKHRAEKVNGTLLVTK